jgi:8-oxo-dGTP pyrophosphatase MutT (NUDIX family)
VQKLAWTGAFQVGHNIPRTVQLLDESNGADTAAACSRAFYEVIEKAVESKTFPFVKTMQWENYRIIGAKYPTVQLLRSAARLFGICSRGAHMTAFVRTNNGIKIWVGRRAAHLVTYPGKLDTTVAGGVRADESPFECIVHEAAEEASLPAEFVRNNAKACGAITYVAASGTAYGDDSNMMTPVILYNYDIELPQHIVPRPQDDEVEDFYLWDLEQVKRAMFNREFKSNCAAVMIDFFIRHGILTDENEKDYVQLATRLHRKLPVPTSPSGL